MECVCGMLSLMVPIHAVKCVEQSISKIDDTFCVALSGSVSEYSSGLCVLCPSTLSVSDASRVAGHHGMCVVETAHTRTYVTDAIAHQLRPL